MLIRQSDVYVMPSECESFSYSFFEPALIGIAIIASKIDTLEELALDGVHFLGFKPASPLDLAEKIVQLIKDNALNEKLRINANKLCEEKYSWDVLSKLYLQMYSSVSTTDC